MQNGKQLNQERHVFVVEAEQGRAFVLEAATYSIGRDVTNAIVINDASISRQHALLLRLPVPGTHLYRYRIVDGNAQGKASANGIYVNGQRCNSCELKNGDLITFGTDVQATYLKVEMAVSDFVEYLEAIQFHSIKSGPVSPKETMVTAAFNGAALEAELEAVRLAEHTVLSVESAHGAPTIRKPRPASLTERTSPKLQHSLQPWLTLSGVALVVLLGLGAWHVTRNPSRPSSEPQPAQTN